MHCGAYCKLNEQEQSEFRAMVEAVEIHQRTQTQVNAGKKAATTRKEKQPPKTAGAAAAGATE